MNKIVSAELAEALFLTAHKGVHYAADVLRTFLFSGGNQGEKNPF
jgi:hypothetical protein